MTNIINSIVLIFLIFLATNNIMIAGSPVLKCGPEPETQYINLDCDVTDIADPFLIKAKTGDLVKFKAKNAEFSILIRNADKFFEKVGQTIKIHLNEGEESDPLIVKGDLPVDSEIKYEVYNDG